MRALSYAYVEGLQQSVEEGVIIGSAKHFIADGGTRGGKDQGNSVIDEAELVRTHAPGFEAALDAGVATVMASYNSWNGEKLHGHEYLLTTILKDRLGFNGFVIGDWNAHEQLRGCTASDCAAAINAGIDMLMAPSDWKPLLETLLRDVKAGVITQERLDDAVRRILRVKLLAGILDAPKPSQREGAGETDALYGDTVKMLAQEAVRASQVLLKNTDTLPIKETTSITVVGAGADDVAVQSGGWTLTWQGDSIANEMFPNGETLLAGLRRKGRQAGATVKFDSEDKLQSRPDLAVVVFWEEAYAEFEGDRRRLSLPSYNEVSMEALRRFKAAEVPTVAIIFAGRPLWIEEVLQNADAVVASWLPGSEAGAIADLLFGADEEGASLDFSGTLPFSWGQERKLAFSQPKEPLFERGYGLRYDNQDAAEANDEIELKKAIAPVSASYDAAALEEILNGGE